MKNGENGGRLIGGEELKEQILAVAEDRPYPWPISKKVKGPTGESMTRWTFVEEFNGLYRQAQERVAALEAEDKGWRYRIWDCR